MRARVLVGFPALSAPTAHPSPVPEGRTGVQRSVSPGLRATEPRSLFYQRARAYKYLNHARSTAATQDAAHWAGYRNYADTVARAR